MTVFDRDAIEPAVSRRGTIAVNSYGLGILARRKAVEYEIDACLAVLTGKTPLAHDLDGHVHNADRSFR